MNLSKLEHVKMVGSASEYETNMKWKQSLHFHKNVQQQQQTVTLPFCLWEHVLDWK